MILIDANLLIYASITSVANHVVAKTWLDAKLNGDAPVGIPRRLNYLENTAIPYVSPATKRCVSVPAMSCTRSPLSLNTE